VTAYQPAAWHDLFTATAGAAGGLYWLVAELVAGFGGIAVNAWILLVEIQR